MLLTPTGERYMRTAVAGGGGDGTATPHCLWWPPSKIAGRLLAPYLSRLDGEDPVAPEADAARAIPIDVALEQTAPGPDGIKRMTIARSPENGLVELQPR